MKTNNSEIKWGLKPHSNKLWCMWLVSPWKGEVFFTTLKTKTLKVSNKGIIKIDIANKGPLFLKSNNIWFLYTISFILNYISNKAFILKTHKKKIVNSLNPTPFLNQMPYVKYELLTSNVSHL